MTPGIRDKKAARRIATRGLCSSCGSKLEGDIVFLVDHSTLRIDEANRPTQNFFRATDLVEPPLHEFCARYSLSACPHLRKLADGVFTNSLSFAYVTGHRSTLNDDGEHEFYIAPWVYRLTNPVTGEVLWADESRRPS